MFSCSACLRRTVATLIQDAPLETFTRPGILSKTQLAKQQTAHHSTIQSIRKGHHVRVLRKALNENRDIRPSRRESVRGPSKVTRRDALARERNRHHLDVEPAAGAEPHGSKLHHRRSDEEYQIQFLTDPLKLATTVLARLRLNDIQGALSLVRLSDKEKVENIVSWNHLMDYEMNFKNVKAAMKIYNEMKKRGHRPDAHTYTIMLRGFTSNINRPQAVENALSVYNSMFAPNSAVTPNIIHTNAVINACARAKNMDALWSVAGKLPEHGPGAPDKWTFTTILNALSASAQRDASQIRTDDGGEASAKVFDAAIDDGRKLWEDIVGRWRRGDVMIDQPLVCAMGRLLLQGSQPRHWNDVFALVEQTMNIAKYRSGGDQAPALEAPKDDTRTGIEFAPVSIVPKESANDKIGATSTSIYAIPGNNTLSMVLQAAIMIKNVPAGRMYWDLLTDQAGPYKVEPDAANLASYLRLLRISRSSKVMVELLQKAGAEDQLPREFWKRGTFVIAMSTCVRDKNNPNVFDHASKVMDMMQDKMEIGGDERGNGMDPKVMGMYVSLAVVTTPGLSHVEPLRSQKFEPDARKNNTMRAIARLGPSVVNVKDLMKKGIQERDLSEGKMPESMKKNWDRVEGRAGQSVDDLASFLQELVGAYDRLLTKANVLPRDYSQECLAQKKKLSAFVTKMVGGAKPGIKTEPRIDRFARNEKRDDVQEEEDEDEIQDALTNHVRRSSPNQRDEDIPGRKSFQQGRERRRAKIGDAIQRREERKRAWLPSSDRRTQAQEVREEVYRRRQEDQGAVLQGWGSGFSEMEKESGLRRESGKSHGMVV